MATRRRRRRLPSSAASGGSDLVATPSADSGGAAPCPSGQIRRWPSSRPRRRLPGSAAHPLEDDNLLAEILLRLRPRPSSLPRASAVCKRWRRLASDPHFHRRFFRHHRKPPLLGILSAPHVLSDNISFTLVLDSPDRIATARFSCRLDEGIQFLGCRHGRVLAVNWKRLHVLVWDPLTGDQRRVAFPTDGKKTHFYSGAIVCAAADQGHVHGGCSSSPFQVVMVRTSREGASACVYSSAAGEWGNLISVLWPDPIHPDEPMPPFIHTACPSALVGNRICWLLGYLLRPAILEFDLATQSLAVAVVDLPRDAYDLKALLHDQRQFLITRVNGSGLGFLALSGFSVKLWKRKADSDGEAGWMLANTIELTSFLSPSPCVYKMPPKILGLDEDGNVMFLWMYDGVVFMVYLDSMEFKKLPHRMSFCHCLPFTSFFTAGMGNGGGHDGIEIVHNA